MVENIVVLGASITSSPWMTWVDFLQAESGKSIVDLSHKGVGNEYITQSLVCQIDKVDHQSLIVIMFTNTDKWDWYVQDGQLAKLRQEKHPPRMISSNSGFWCTGSWFPGEKKIFHQQFYNQDYFCADTIRNILLVKEIARYRRAKIEIFFDSPIWHYTEQDINSKVDGQPISPRDLLQGDLSSHWSELLEPHEKNIDQTSLIGYCWQEGLEWCNAKYKGHPPAGSHYSWYLSVMRPRLQKHLSLKDMSVALQSKITQMDALWQKS